MRHFSEFGRRMTLVGVIALATTLPALGQGPGGGGGGMAGGAGFTGGAGAGATGGARAGAGGTTGAAASNFLSPHFRSVYVTGLAAVDTGEAARTAAVASLVSNTVPAFGAPTFG